MDNLIADVVGDVALVLVAAWLLGALARRVGQPAVVGQMIAGILLGPSVLGRFPGHLTSHLFPHAALSTLNALSQLAIVIFMFGVGYELDRHSLRAKRRAAVLIAVGALLVPAGLGSGAAVIFRSSFAALGQLPAGHSFAEFMGVTVAITALPVLAAILREHDIAGTMVGVTATTAAGIMDVAAWLLLAVAVTGVSHSHGRPWPLTLLLISVFAAAMLLVVRPALRWWLDRRGVLAEKLPIAMGVALCSAWVTASLGLHPVFGGFLAGLAFPRAEGGPDADVLAPMDEVARALLPLFFMVTGLSVDIGAMNGTALGLLVLLCAIAAGGKLIPGYVAARVGGMRPRESAALAVLVNTRGLTELIALNVGLTAGLLSDQLFSVLVVMAVIMTVMTAPLLRVTRLPSSAAPVVPITSTGKLQG